MQETTKSQTSTGQVTVLVIIAVVLGLAYLGLDMYTDGEKYVAMTESRGTQIIQGLSKHKLETNAYPESLEKLTPKFIAALPKCPGGEAFAYALASAEFTLACQKVVFKMKPYGYDSRSKAWQG